MFESCTKKERMSVAKLGLVVALAGAAFAAQAALFVGMIGQPLAAAMAGVRTLPPRAVTKDDLPDFGEEIVVTAPYRMRLATPAVHVTPWKVPDPVTVALNGYCLMER